MAELVPDYKKIYKIATEDILIGSSSLMSLPIDMHKHIIEQTDIKLFSYQKAHEKYGLNIADMGSKDALITEIAGRFILFYKKYEDEHRNRWSYAHEIGHVYLEHELNVETISKERYNLQEEEANIFAAQVLMPDLLLWELVDRGAELSIENLSKWFDVSARAAEIRLKTLNGQYEFRKYYAEKDYFELLMIKYGLFVDAIIPKHSKYSSYDYDEEEEMQCIRDSWNYRK